MRDLGIALHAVAVEPERGDTILEEAFQAQAEADSLAVLVGGTIDNALVARHYQSSYVECFYDTMVDQVHHDLAQRVTELPPNSNTLETVLAPLQQTPRTSYYVPGLGMQDTRAMRGSSRSATNRLNHVIDIDAEEDDGIQLQTSAASRRFPMGRQQHRTPSDVVGVSGARLATHRTPPDVVGVSGARLATHRTPPEPIELYGAGMATHAATPAPSVAPPAADMTTAMFHRAIKRLRRSQMDTTLGSPERNEAGNALRASLLKPSPAKRAIEALYSDTTSSDGGEENQVNSQDAADFLKFVYE